MSEDISAIYGQALIQCGHGLEEIQLHLTLDIMALLAPDHCSTDRLQEFLLLFGIPLPDPLSLCLEEQAATLLTAHVCSPFAFGLIESYRGRSTCFEAERFVGVL